jgi:hypothetical protein
MAKYIHRTSSSSSYTPVSSEIDIGEITINSSVLGSSNAGFNNGRLYIKLSNGEIRRFISLGLPGSSDETLKTKYGGTNNSFSSVAAPSNISGKSLVYFNYNSGFDHSLEKTDNDTLTWDTSNNRLKVGGSSAVPAQATLDVNGNVRISTISEFSSIFNDSFSILGWSPVSYNLSHVPSKSFFSYLPDNSLSQTKISGTLTTTKGGTGVNIGTDIPTPTNGSLFYYNTSSNRFDADNNFRWNSSINVLYIGGSVEFNPPIDVTHNATPVGVDSSNRIVKLTSNNSNNLSFSKIVTGSNLIEASSNTDTLNVQSGPGISITANSSSNTITISSISAFVSKNTKGTSDVVVSGDITLLNVDNKYQFLNPSGLNNSINNIVLDTAGVIEGKEFLIRNMDDTGTNTLSVYNSIGSNLLASLNGSTLFGHFLFDGYNWRLLTTGS